MAEEGFVTCYYLEEEGFPKLLAACMQRFGIKSRPEYDSSEYEEYGTLRCEMNVHIGRSRDHPDIDSFKVTATGFRWNDTYQVAARKALRYLCQIYERLVAHTPMRFFPPMKKNRPVWSARMRTLEG